MVLFLIMIEDFLRFIKSPKLSTNYYNKPIDKLFVLLIGFFFSMLGLYLAALLNKSLIVFGFEDISNYRQVSYDFNLQNFFIVVLVAPILEELCFRLPLKPTRLIYAPVSLALLSFFFLNFFFDAYLNNYLIFTISCFVLVLFFLVRVFITKYIKKNYKMVFYTSALLFAILHLKSLNDFLDYFFLIPLLLLPYFVYALSFSYVRMKAGLHISILLHVSINAIAFFLKYLLWITSQ